MYSSPEPQPDTSEAVRFRPALRYLLPLVVFSVGSWLGTLLSAGLLGSPALLVALAPRAAFVAFASSTVDTVPLVTLAAVRMWLPGLLACAVGRQYGDTARSMLIRQGRFGRWLTHRFLTFYERFGALAVLVRPNQTVMLLAGIARLPLSLAAILSAVGSAGYASMLVLSGQAAVPAFTHLFSRLVPGS